jgi:hypothetical protein
MGAPVIGHPNASALHPHLQPAQVEGKKELFFSDELYTPEALFSAWLNLSFFSVTTALLFYHMTQAKSIEADPRIAAFLAIALMVISCGYVYYSVGPYIERMDYVANKCRVLKECSNKQVDSIIRHKRIYQILGYGTIGIETIIAVLILYKTRNLMRL